MRGSLHAHARSNKLISGEKCDLPVAKMHKPYCTAQLLTPQASVPGCVLNFIQSGKLQRIKLTLTKVSRKNKKKKGGGVRWKGRSEPIVRFHEAIKWR